MRDFVLNCLFFCLVATGTIGGGILGWRLGYYLFGMPLDAVLIAFFGGGFGFFVGFALGLILDDVLSGVYTSWRKWLIRLRVCRRVKNDFPMLDTKEVIKTFFDRYYWRVQYDVVPFEQSLSDCIVHCKKSFELKKRLRPMAEKKLKDEHAARDLIEPLLDECDTLREQGVTGDTFLQKGWLRLQARHSIQAQLRQQGYEHTFTTRLVDDAVLFMERGESYLVTVAPRSTQEIVRYACGASPWGCPPSWSCFGSCATADTIDIPAKAAIILKKSLN